MNPYLDGVNAYKAGKKRNANPHHMATAMHEAWDEGYVDAEAAAERTAA